MDIAAAPLEGTQNETIDGDIRQVIRSPEQVALHLPIAGPASRMLAYAIDAAVLFLLEAGVLVLLFLTTPLLSRLEGPLRRLMAEVSNGNGEQVTHNSAVLLILGLFLLMQFTVEWGYFLVWETLSGGRSLGKLCVRLRVVRDGGLPLTLRESLVRNLLRMVDLLPGSYAVGLIAMVLSDEGKRLGDYAAGTIVVRLDRPEAAIPLIDIAADDLGSFRFDRAHIALLGGTERALLRQTLRRVETLPADLVDPMLEHAVEALRQRIGYCPVHPKDRQLFLKALLHATRRQ